MANYVDKSTQTLIEGLARDPAARPAALCSHTNTTTPPDDMAIDKLRLEGTPTVNKTQADDRNISTPQLLHREGRPRLVARISLPPSEFGSENPRSPPPTEAVFSPLPAANTLHAGHTPIIPRALSPLQHHDASSPSISDQEEPLSGPLTLPPQPGDGAEDKIPLDALNAELEKLHKEQEMAEQHEGQAIDPTESAEYGDRLSLKGSPEGRRPSDEVEVVDGVILKKPKMNLGAPLGQA